MNAMLKRYMQLGFSFSIGVYPGLRRRKAPPLDNLESGLTLQENLEPQPAPQPPKVAIFSGTVVRSGERFAIRLAGGALYPVDSTSRAWPFEGEDVQITGSLDAATRMIHIVAIQCADDPGIGSRMTA